MMMILPSPITTLLKSSRLLMRLVQQEEVLLYTSFRSQSAPMQKRLLIPPEIKQPKLGVILKRKQRKGIVSYNTLKKTF